MSKIHYGIFLLVTAAILGGCQNAMSPDVRQMAWGMTPQEVMAIEKEADNDEGEWKKDEEHQKILCYDDIQDNEKRAYVCYQFVDQLKKPPFMDYMLELPGATEKLEAAGDDKDSEAAHEAVAALDRYLADYDQLPDTRTFGEFRLNSVTISWLDLNEDESKQRLLALHKDYGEPLDESDNYRWENARSEITYNTAQDFVTYTAKYALQEEWTSPSEP